MSFLYRKFTICITSGLYSFISSSLQKPTSCILSHFISLQKFHQLNYFRYLLLQSLFPEAVVYLYSLICLSDGVVALHSYCFIILLHHAPPKVASVLVLFVIFGGHFSISLYRQAQREFLLLLWWAVLQLFNLLCCIEGQSTSWRQLTVTSSLLFIVLLGCFRLLN